MTTANGTTPRRNLESQLDRFDRILDGLADGLNGSVATAVKETVGQAVREAIPEGFRALARDPALAAALHGACPTPADLVFDGTAIRPVEPPRFPALTNLLTQMRRRAARRWHETRALAALAWHYCRRVLAVLLAVLLLGLAGYLTGPVLCGAFGAGLLASVSAAAAWQRWRRRQPTALADHLDVASPTSEPAASTTATTAAV